MKHIILCMSILISAIFAFSVGKEPLTKEQKVVALVENGLAFLEKNGKEKSIAAFNDPNGKFIDGEFYLFGYTMKGVCLVMGAKPKMVNQNLYEMTDTDGKFIIQDFIKIASTNGKGWSYYKWLNPVTKKIKDKASYVVYVKDMDLILGCGFSK